MKYSVLPALCSPIKMIWCKKAMAGYENQASQTDEQRVFEFVMKRKEIMPRTALRYAIESI